MKRLGQISIHLCVGLLVGMAFMGTTSVKATPSAGLEMGIDVGFDFYSSDLNSYGEWVSVGYGRAWRPHHVGYGWRPYMNGRWLWTDDGWYWSSYEPFGWATYHYGRWTYDDYYGWIWIPGNVWAPAWVEWRYNDNYIGWAPLCPDAEFSFSFGIRYRTAWYAPVHYWNFVPCRNFAAVHINEYVAPIERSRRFFGSTRGVNRIEAGGDRVINRGVDRGFIERRGNIRIGQAEVVNGERGREERVLRADGGRERVEVFRPRIDSRAAERNNSEGRSYNEMHGVAAPEARSERRAIEQPGRRQAAAPDRSTWNRGTEQQTRETPRRGIERRQMNRPELRTETRGGFSRPQRGATSAPRPESRSGNPGRGGRRP